jgi:hypothetical protein
MTTIRKNSIIKRNDRCPCGSGKKFKSCHSPDAPSNRNSYAPAAKAASYIDTGESAVKYVICDDTGVKFFSDIDNKILVFSSREEAVAIAHLEEFADQAPGEINVAGVGPTKWEHLQATLPFIEVKSVEHAVELIKARMGVQQAKLDSLPDTLDPADEAQPANES